MPKVFASKARPAGPWRAHRASEDYGMTADPDWRSVDWQAHLHRVPIDGAEVSYVDIGPTGLTPGSSAGSSGGRPPVVFVHGLGGQWQNWLENIPRVARERRVIALDLPGFGLSDMPHERITIPGYGRAVDALCDFLGVDHVALVGNSMGGFVASEVAIQFPERADRLVLVSAAGISSASVSRAPVLTFGRVATILSSYSAARHEALARRPRSRHFSLALVARYPARLKPDLVYEGFMKGVGKPGFDDALRACLEYDFRDRLTEIACPTLVVWGENDFILPVRDAHEFERLIPDTRKLVMDETGHIPQAERPEIFNAALLEFLGAVGEAREKEAQTA
jgi:pimeloyl-ACP methyl ester carboxylesterase